MTRRQYGLLLTALFACFLSLMLFFMNESRKLSVDEQSAESYHIQVVLKARANPPDFWRIVEQGVDVASEEYNVRCEVNGPVMERDIDQQIALVEQAIAKKPDALILAACDYERLVPVCEKAVAQGILLLTLDSGVDYDEVKSFVGTDNYALGQKLGELVDTLIAPEERFGVVGHMATVTTGTERERGLMDGVKDVENRLAGIEYCESSPELGEAQARKMLEDNPDIKCMVGLNESSAIGVARAVRGMGLSGKVKVVCCDSSQEQIELMEDGTIQAFVIQNPFNMGYMSVKSAVELLRGGQVSARVNTDSVVVTMETLYKKENQKLLFPFTSAE